MTLLSTGFVVYNFAHSDTCIRSTTGAVIRVLGAFATAEQATEFCAEWARECADLEVRVSPMHAWRVASKTYLNPDDQNERLMDMLVVYSEDRKKAFEDVETRASAKVAGEAEAAQPAQPSDAADAEIEEAHEESKATGLPRVPAHLRVTGQSLVGVAILPDLAATTARSSLAEHEPAFEFLCVADTEEDIQTVFHEWSNKYLVNADGTANLGIHASVPLACVSMYETFHPAAFATARRHVSRDPRLAELKEALVAKT